MDDELKALRAEAVQYLKDNWDHGGTCEFDGRINDISRRTVEAFKRVHGKAFLGKINRYKEDDGKPYLVEYIGQKIYNFEYAFVIPCYDENLIELIQRREQAPYEGTGKDYERVSVIMNRIIELQGDYLIWA